MNFPVAIIVIAQLFGTSLWFSANSAAADLTRLWSLTPAQLGQLTGATQAGFIGGTLLFAVTGLADRFPASRIFAVSAVIGALGNAGFALMSHGVSDALAYRFLVGISLAGIYPLGMKLVVTWAPDKTGQALGWLVGTLTVGTALPHLIRGLGSGWNWQIVVLLSSVLSLLAAIGIFFLGDGPAHGKHLPPRTGGVLSVFRLPDFRSAVFGYFGHMWELYAFWTITPFLVAVLVEREKWGPAGVVSVLSFLVIGIGGLGCVLGGSLSRRIGSARVAGGAMAGSALVCLVYPFIQTAPSILVLFLLFFWGLMVVADSPQFSALAARACPPGMVGSSLAVMNSIGFLITVFSINIVASRWDSLGPEVVWILLPGPVLGLWGLARLIKKGI